MLSNIASPATQSAHLHRWTRSNSIPGPRPPPTSTHPFNPKLAREILPTRTGLSISHVGDTPPWTRLDNLRPVAASMSAAENNTLFEPHSLVKFLARHLGCGQYHSNGLRGLHTLAALEAALDVFVLGYILCAACRSADTAVVKVNRKGKCAIACRTCGHQSAAQDSTLFKTSRSKPKPTSRYQKQKPAYAGPGRTRLPNASLAIAADQKQEGHRHHELSAQHATAEPCCRSSAEVVPTHRRPARKPRVLFMHGLESGPGGSKERWLSKHFDVHCVDMNVGVLGARKCHSPAQAVLACSTCILAGVAWSLYCKVPPTIVCAAAATAAIVLPPLLARLHMRVAFHACVDAQRHALALYQPDLVVGSSWGGAVALRCIELQLWAGPTLLLAPAVAGRGWWAIAWGHLAFLLPREAAKQCIVVHGADDQVVALAAVADMCVRNGVRLQVVPGVGHRLNDMLLLRRGRRFRALIADVLSIG